MTQVHFSFPFPPQIVFQSQRQKKFYYFEFIFAKSWGFLNPDIKLNFLESEISRLKRNFSLFLMLSSWNRRRGSLSDCVTWDVRLLKKNNFVGKFLIAFLSALKKSLEPFFLSRNWRLFLEFGLKVFPWNQVRSILKQGFIVFLENGVQSIFKKWKSFHQNFDLKSSLNSNLFSCLPGNKVQSLHAKITFII